MAALPLPAQPAPEHKRSACLGCGTSPSPGSSIVIVQPDFDLQLKHSLLDEACPWRWGQGSREHPCSVWLVEQPSRGPAFPPSHQVKLGGFGDQPEEAMTVFPSHPALQRVTHAAPELLQQVQARCLASWCPAGGCPQRRRECIASGMLSSSRADLQPAAAAVWPAGRYGVAGSAGKLLCKGSRLGQLLSPPTPPACRPPG